MQQTGIGIDQELCEAKSEKNRYQHSTYGQEWHADFMSQVTVNYHAWINLPDGNCYDMDCLQVNLSCADPKTPLITGVVVKILRQHLRYWCKMRVNLLAQILVLAWTLLGAGVAFSGDERLSGFSAGDTILIQANHAWEAVAPDTIHFSGQFELKAHDWYLSADQATLHGDLDNPDTAILKGSPAKIQLEIVSDDKIETITGEAARIVYQRVTNSIKLEGGASLSRAGQTMQSEEIEYDIEQDRIQAGGSQGVQIRVNPEDLPDF